MDEKCKWNDTTKSKAHALHARGKQQEGREGRVGLYHARKHVGKAMERLHASCFFVVCAVEVKACHLVPCVANLGVEARPLEG